MSCARGWGSAVPADHLDTVALDTSVTLASSTPEREPLSRRSSIVFATALAMVRLLFSCGGCCGFWLEGVELRRKRASLVVARFLQLPEHCVQFPEPF